MIVTSFIRVMKSLRDVAGQFRRNERGIAATEFAVIVPLMLTMFFGTLEMCSGVAVDRKVTLIAHTLSDLTSQSPSSGVTDGDFTNFFTASGLIMWPYSATPINASISELYINPANGKAVVQWSRKNDGTTPRTTKSIVDIPSGLIMKDSSGNVLDNQYLIFSETSYLYVPAIGYIMNKLGVTLSDVNYTRPRQSTCILYGTQSTCPKSV